MSLVAADLFEGPTLAAWWRQVNAAQLQNPISFGSDAIGSYALFELAVGGAGGSFLFNNNDGYVCSQRAKGDLDVAVLIRVFDLSQTTVPDGGAARLAGPCIHDPAKPERPEYLVSTWRYHHFVIGRAPGGAEGDTQPVGEWKLTTSSGGSSSSLWNTVPHESPGDCLCWIRLRRVGNVITSYSAPYAGTKIPPTAWTQRDSRAAAQLPDMVDVGICIYSSVANADVAARVYAFLPLLAA